jgi:hypothetical protein
MIRGHIAFRLVLRGFHKAARTMSTTDLKDFIDAVRGELNILAEVASRD